MRSVTPQNSASKSRITRLMASAIYRGINLLYRAAPCERTVSLLLHLNKYVGQATWMVVCRHFDESLLRNDRLMRFTQEFLEAQVAPGDTVLDVGCHEGHLTRYIGSLCRRVVGIDTDEGLLARARWLGTLPNAEFRVQDVGALQAGEQFDVVCLHHVLEHIEDVSEVLAALTRVSPKALIEVPDIEQNWSQCLLRDLRGDYFSDSTHVREYDKALMLEHLRSAGLEVIEILQVSEVIQVAARWGPERQAA